MAGSMPVPPLYRDAAAVPDPVCRRVAGAGSSPGRPEGSGSGAEPAGLPGSRAQNRQVSPGCGVGGDQSPCLGGGPAGHGGGVWTRARADSGVFADRDEAGRALGERLRSVALDDPVVLALPRGGVPVAARVAEALHAPLDVMVVRKVGVPHRPELAMGAVSEEGARIVEEHVTRAARVPRGSTTSPSRRRSVRSPAWRGRSEATGRRCRWPVAPSWWSTTASRPAPPHGPPAGRPAPVAPPRGLRGAGRADRLRRGAAGRRRRRRRPEDAASTSARSATGTATSTRSATSRSPRSWRGCGTRPESTPQERADGPRNAGRRRGPRRPDPRRRRGAVRAPVPARRGPRPGRLRPRQRQQRAQPPEPLRGAGAAAAPGSARCCSTCSPPRRSATAATSSTSRCSRSGCGWRPTGCAAPRPASPRPPPSATSVRAPERPRR